MAKQDVKAEVAEADKKAADDEAELARMLAEEEAKAKAAEAVVVANVPAPPPAQKPVGDVKVVALKTENRILKGKREYALRQGQELLMDPSHAKELEQTGWVLSRASSLGGLLMAGSASADLIRALRSRLSDDRPNVPAFTIGVKAKCKSALFEVVDGALTVTVEGGEGIKSIRWVLSSPDVSTIGRLINKLQREPGYSAEPDVSAQLDKASVDLYVSGIHTISGGSTYTLKHRMFSDSELRDLLDEAIQLHNPSMTANTVPQSERVFILLKATARAYRVLAGDTAKRKGLDTDANLLLKLAGDLDKEYDDAHGRLVRTIQAPVVDESKVGPGDVMEGKMFRRSLRAGYNAPYRNANPPTPPELYQPQDDDIEDVMVRLRWAQNRDYSFAHYELWRDTDPRVDRNLAGRLEMQLASAGPALPVQTQYSRASTSKQVLGVSFGATASTPIFNGFYFGTASEQPGSILTNTSFVDGYVVLSQSSQQFRVLGEPLEPEYEYYYRMYVVDRNGEILPSNVLKVRTKAMRARFKRNESRALASDALSVSSGALAGGTTVTIKGTDFADTMSVLINGKACSLTVASSTQATIVTPGFSNPDFINKPMDLVIVSRNGLRDIVARGWTYT